MRGKRTSLKDKEKVIKAKLNNPDLSLRDLQKETGINRQTNQRILEELPIEVTRCDNGAKLIETMDKIINEIAEMTSLSMNTFKEKILNKELNVNDVKSLNDIAKNNFDRKQLLTGKATSNVNVIGDILKDIQGIEKE